LPIHSIRADRPLNENIRNILHQFDTVARELRLDYFLAGATARDMMLTHVFGIDTARVTRDVDLGIAVADWDAFNAIKARLLSNSDNWTPSESPQLLLYREQNAAFATPVDLIPFGQIEHPPHEIAWPPDMDVLMNVTGYADALGSAAMVMLAEDVVIRVASIPGLAALKLIAWDDRGKIDAKDAHDLFTILRRYSDAGNHDRLYNDHFAQIESADYDPEMAGAWLLGADIVSMASEETLAALNAILADERKVNLLMVHMARSYHAENALTYIGKLLQQFTSGLVP
jgi:predicted nucleotidyltransferase